MQYYVTTVCQTGPTNEDIMSAVCILTPIVIASWPALSAAVVQLAIDQSELVTDRLDRTRQITVERDGVTVTFSRDARGKAGLCVSGTGHTDSELRTMGEELSQRVVQHYVYQRLKEEIQAREFVVIEEEVDANNAIHMKVRHWQSAA